MRFAAALCSALLASTANAGTYGPYPSETFEISGQVHSTTALVITHGGWDLGGTYTDNPTVNEIAAFMARRNMAVFVNNYRLARGTGNGWPAAWQDEQTMVRYVRSLGYARVCVVGLSAGGYNLLGIVFKKGTMVWAPTDPAGESQLYPGHASEPDCAIAISPFSNLNDPKLSPLAVKAITRGIARPITAMDQATINSIASPVTHIRPDVAPLIIVHGKNDGLVPNGQSVTLARELLDIGGVVQYIPTGGGHLFSGLGTAEQNHIMRVAADCVLQAPGSICAE